MLLKRVKKQEKKSEDKIYCLRCDAELTEDRPFCDACLEHMKKYPVKTDAVVMLPNRTDADVKKQAHRKRPLSPEEQVTLMKRLLRWVIAVAAVLLLALTLATGLLIQQYLKEQAAQQPVGRNYTITTEEKDGCSTWNID